MINSIKITEAHRDAIEAALMSANGKATAHTYTRYEEIDQIAERAETKIVAIVGAKSRAVGTEATSVSGAVVAAAYKHSRTATRVHLVRRATGWFLDGVRPTLVYTYGGCPLALSVTPEIHAAATGELLKQYSVRTE